MSGRSRKARIDAIDIVRGVLMCVITLGHALSNLDPTTTLADALRAPLGILVRFGTPGFVMVSGTLMGYFAVMRADMAPILRKYRQRGVTLLLTTHALIAVALYYPITGGGRPFAEFFWTRWYITDTLAFIFILFAPAIVALAPLQRLVGGIAVLAISPFVMVGLHPVWQPALVFKQVAFGSWGETSFLDDAYAVVPLTAMFMVAAFFGDRYGRAVREDRTDGYLRWQLSLTPVLLAATAVMVTIWWVVRAGWLGGSSFLRDVFYPDRAFTLFGFYLAAYLALFSFWIWRSQLRGEATTRLDRAFVVFGRTSLFTYVAQYVVVQTIPWALGLQSSLSPAGVAVLCVVAFPILHFCAVQWESVVLGRGTASRSLAAAPAVTIPRRAA